MSSAVGVAAPAPSTRQKQIPQHAKIAIENIKIEKRMVCRIRRNHALNCWKYNSVCRSRNRASSRKGSVLTKLRRACCLSGYPLISPPLARACTERKTTMSTSRPPFHRCYCVRPRLRYVPLLVVCLLPRDYPPVVVVVVVRPGQQLAGGCSRRCLQCVDPLKRLAPRPPRLRGLPPTRRVVGDGQGEMGGC